LLDAAAELQSDTAGDDPGAWRRSVSIRLNDALIPVLAPRLTRQVTTTAPGVRLRFVAQTSKDPELLRDGSIDLDVGVAAPPPPDVHATKLFTDHFVAVVAATSKLGRAARLTVDDLCAHPHISASRRGLAQGPLDEALEQIGRARRVAAIVPSYAVGALMALENDVICLIPSITAAHLVEQGVPIRVHAVPFDLPTADIELRWHRRVDQDPISIWLRGCVRHAVQPLTAAPSQHAE
jgi:DNA-binding transcriptional LysR family regulator